MRRPFSHKEFVAAFRRHFGRSACISPGICRANRGLLLAAACWRLRPAGHCRSSDRRGTQDGSRPDVRAHVARNRERLGNAKHRGIDVRAIVDRSQLKEDRSDTYAVGRLASGGVPVLVDTVPGLMHNKIMIVDGATVITGSFNYTWSAEHRNAENLLVIHDPTLAAEYTQNWNIHAARSWPLATSAEGASPSAQAAPKAAAGPIVGNRRSMIYEWPGCPYYDKIAPRNRVSFPNAQAAEAAGYRPAKNCP